MFLFYQKYLICDLYLPRVTGTFPALAASLAAEVLGRHLPRAPTVTPRLANPLASASRRLNKILGTEVLVSSATTATTTSRGTVVDRRDTRDSTTALARLSDRRMVTIAGNSASIRVQINATAVHRVIVILTIVLTSLEITGQDQMTMNLSRFPMIKGLYVKISFLLRLPRLAPQGLVIVPVMSPPFSVQKAQLPLVLNNEGGRR